MFYRLNNRMKALKKSHGFSLVELLIVIVILAILAVAVFAGGSVAIKKAQVSQVTSDLHNFSVAIESTLNENPSVANLTAGDTVVAMLNKNLPADYQLNLLDSTHTIDGTNITSTADGTTSHPFSTYCIAKSEKTDAWDNPYYVVFDSADRTAGSDFFITVISAGPNAKTALDGSINADDIFLLAQYTSGDVSAVTYNMEETPTLVFNAASAPTNPAYAHSTDAAANCPVIFK